MSVWWTNTWLRPETVAVRDVWAKANRGSFAHGFTTNVASHATAIVTVRGQPLGFPAYLSDLPLEPLANGYGWLRNGRVGAWAASPSRMRTNWENWYLHGFGVQAPCELKFDLSKIRRRALRFIPEVGIDYSASNPGGTATAEVWGDQRLLWRSGETMTHITPVKRVEVDLGGIKELVLRTADGGDGNEKDWVNWGDCIVLFAQ